MENVIDLADPPIFDRDKWVGKGATYSRQSLPYFVIDACTKAFAIPPQERSRFPARNIRVADFLKTAIPPRDSAFITTKAQSWFKDDLPSGNLDFLVDRKIPDKAFLQKLDRVACQAWLDGAQSLADPRYNDGVNRMPLWVLSYWKEMRELADAKVSWARCKRWLSVASDTTSQSEAVSEAFADVAAFLPGLGWNTPVHGLDNQQTTLEFTKLLGDDWLSTALLQMMIDHLSARVKADPKLASSIIIAGPSLAEAMESADVRGLEYSRKSTPLLSRYEHHIKSKNLNHLYFPAHVNGNHWIAVHVDFEQREFCYGDSLGGQTPKIMGAVKRWLHGQFKFEGRWKEKGNTLPIGKQHDSNSCGLCVINTFACAIFGDQMWTQSRATLERAKWFSVLAKTHLKQDTLTASPVVDLVDEELLNEPEISLAIGIGDHNFPDLKQFALGSDPGTSVIQMAPSTEQKSSDSSAFALSNILNPVTHTDQIPTTPAVIPYDDTGFTGSTPFEADVSSMDTTSVDIISINATSSADNMSIFPTGSSGVFSASSDVPSELLSISPRSASSLEQTHQSDAGKAKKSTSGQGIIGWLNGRTGSLTGKRKKTDVESSSVSSIEAKPEKKSLKKSARAGFRSVIGQSKSAVAGRTQRALAKEGNYTLDSKRFEKWKSDILLMDPDAEVDQKTAYWVRHSSCATVYKLKQPYDRTRFRKHIKDCPFKDKPAPLASTPAISQWESVFNIKLVAPSQQPEFLRPCPGLQPLDDSRIATYLECSGASGGGARSITAISKQRFQKMFKKLTSRRKEEVIDAQVHEYRWKNDHKRTRIYSSACLQEVVTLSEAERALPCPKCTELLRDRHFKQALKKLRPDDEHCAYINERWRPPRKVAELYGRVHGLQEIFETA
ncbi:hypothetical protein HWV62_36215, partial [Athelia sp. TMB]